MTYQMKSGYIKMYNVQFTMYNVQIIIRITGGFTVFLCQIAESDVKKLDFRTQLCYNNVHEKGGVIMPRIIPIRDLKKTGSISQMCQELDEPIFVTKNGYGEMVIMSMKMYEEIMFMQNVYNKLAEAETEVAAGKTKNAKESLKLTREKYDV